MIKMIQSSGLKSEPWGALKERARAPAALECRLTCDTGAGRFPGPVRILVAAYLPHTTECGDTAESPEADFTSVHFCFCGETKGNI